MNQDQKPAVVFDAFGTLFDLSRLGERMGEHISQAESVASVWRGTQLQYAFIRSMTAAYADFDQITREALDRALALHDIDPSAETRQRLVDLWSDLPLYPDATAMLEKLQDHTRAILTNGTFDTVTSLLKNAGIENAVDMVISADSVARFKPDPLVYEMAPAALGVRRESIHFVTANAFDVAGGKAAGFIVYWINRSGLPFDAVGWEPDARVQSLSELPGRIA